MICSGVLGEGTAPEEPNLTELDGVANSTYLRPKLVATVEPRSV